MKYIILYRMLRKIDVVEAHVLRYWEEELELEIPRNEMGHCF